MKTDVSASRHVQTKRPWQAEDLRIDERVAHIRGVWHGWLCVVLVAIRTRMGGCPLPSVVGLAEMPTSSTVSQGGVGDPLFDKVVGR
jgi:hypothetical protein